MPSVDGIMVSSNAICCAAECSEMVEVKMNSASEKLIESVEKEKERKKYFHYIKFA